MLTLIKINMNLKRFKDAPHRLLRLECQLYAS